MNKLNDGNFIGAAYIRFVFNPVYLKLLLSDFLSLLWMLSHSRVGSYFGCGFLPVLIF